MARAQGDIDSSRVPVDGIGGLGLVATAVVVAYLIRPLRPLGIAVPMGGLAIALALVAWRQRARRRVALASLAVLIALGGVAVYAFVGH